MLLKKISSTLFVLGCVMSTTPVAVHAYYTTHQFAQRLTPTIALYAITYEFGMHDQDTYLPIITKRGLSTGTSTSPFITGYTLTDGKGTAITTGSTTALVLSTAPIVNNQYKVAAGNEGLFTIFVVQSMPLNTPLAQYQLTVTHLPFIFHDTTTGTTTEQLNQYELSNYITPVVDLGQ